MVKRRTAIKYFEAHGFRNEGGANHDHYVHPDGRRTVIGRHREIDNNRFEDMKKQAGLR